MPRSTLFAVTLHCTVPRSEPFAVALHCTVPRSAPFKVLLHCTVLWRSWRSGGIPPLIVNHGGEWSYLRPGNFRNSVTPPSDVRLSAYRFLLNSDLLYGIRWCSSIWNLTQISQYIWKSIPSIFGASAPSGPWPPSKGAPFYPIPSLSSCNAPPCTMSSIFFLVFLPILCCGISYSSSFLGSSYRFYDVIRFFFV